MTYKLKHIIYLVIVSSITASNFVEAKKGARKVLCGNGATVIVYDKKSGTASKACKKKGHTPPKVNVNPTMQMGLHSAQNQNADKDCQWDPNSARFPDCKKKLKKKDDCKYDPDSAKLPCSNNKPKSLLLPAVQAVVSASMGSKCGSDSSISRALDKCGKKGFKFALCKKNNGSWSCSPSTDKSNPKVRPTGLSNRVR